MQAKPSTTRSRSAVVLACLGLGLLLVPGRAAAAVDLSLAVQDGPDPALVGSPLSYSVAVSNVGSTTVPGATLTAALSPSTELLTFGATRGRCTGSRLLVTCGLGALEPGATVAAIVSVRPIGPGRITARFTGTGGGLTDSKKANNSTTAVTDVELRRGACANPRLGTPLDDMLEGTTGGDTMFGRRGKDLLRGQAGADCLHGQEGDDRLDGGEDRDVISGGPGDDVLAGRAGDDLLLGRSGSDSLFGFEGADALFGGAGTDQLVGGPGADRLVTGGGGDAAYGGPGRDTMSGGRGGDTFFAGPGGDRVAGGAGDDILGAGSGRDVVRGGRGADTIFEAERVSGGPGDDEIYARPGAVLRCGPGTDTVFVPGRPTVTGSGDCEGVVERAGGSAPSYIPPVSFECAFGVTPMCSAGAMGTQPLKRKQRRRRRQCRRRRCPPLVINQRVDRPLAERLGRP